MKYIKSLSLAFVLLINSTVFASVPDEGMWLPLLLKDYNYEEMKRLGCTLTPEQIYSVNNSSLKDAVVQLGGFCTAEIISDQGLLLTNHHCAYDAIASSSTVENDYLTDGFWSMSLGEEIPIEGLTVSFLVRMEDVTKRIKDRMEDAGGENAMMAAAEEMEEIQAEAMEGTAYTAEVKTMFDGNAYYLFVYETYNDIRLVGAPPSSVGKFGGDTDNWMWPRHTGDFSMLRIYAGADNAPAAYSADNKPFKPKHSLPVNVNGLEDGDFTMIMGFPGRTDRYMTSFEVQNQMTNEAPMYVKILEKRLAIMKAEMDKDDATRIAKASDYASLANTYKYFKGQLRGLNKFDLVKTKEMYEANLTKWVNSDDKLKDKYGEVLPGMKSAYETYGPVTKNNAVINMAGFGPEFVAYGIPMWRLQSIMEREGTEDKQQEMIDEFKMGVDAHFEGYYSLMDQNITAACLEFMQNDMSSDAQMDLFSSKMYTKKAKGSNEKMAALIFKKSILTDKKRLQKFLAKPSLKVLQKDPGVMYINSVINVYRSKLQMSMMMMGGTVDPLREAYVAMLQEKESGKNFYPDANSTMRVTYGTVGAYKSWEGKPYETFTYAHQIMDKYKPGDEEFDVPEKLRQLIGTKNYGPYKNKEGKLPVCFLHNTDITGGNSGSPVINGKGEIVGVAFDGNWESMTSDLFWQDEYVRTISVDIRYVLFIIDKYAGCQRLLDEMNLVK